MNTACVKKFCSKDVKRTMKRMNKLNTLLGASKATRKISKNPKMIKMTQELCKKQHCNPTCKNTEYELKSKIKDELQLFLRKMISKKENILKNDFYEKIPKNKVNDLKKKGAISGCHK